MALTYTPNAEIGSTCPDFELPAVDGKTYSNKNFAQAKAKVFSFICNHCPYVMAIEDRLIQLAREFENKGVQFVAICSNDPTDHPEDSFDNLKARWQQKQYGFPYLHDESQQVAKAFSAVCTPDIFVFDKDDLLYYRGRLDDSWKDSSTVQKQELKLAIESLLSGEPPSKNQNPSMGCSIKWKNDL